jgi:hypothetical protein
VARSAPILGVEELHPLARALQPLEERLRVPELGGGLHRSNGQQ